MRLLLTAAFLFSTLAFSACKKSGTAETVITTTDPPGNINTIVKDCIPGNPGCIELIVPGDPYYTPPSGPNTFSGYADPGLRRDPQSNTLWFTYSWPNYRIVNGNRIGAVDIHMAKSTDSGATFSFVQNLWPAVQMNNPASPAQAGCLNNETSNLLPVFDGTSVTWYAASFNYFIYNNGSGNAYAGNSFQIRIYKAASPQGLATATPSILGTYSLDASWGSIKNLAALSPELHSLDFWCEPALYYENGTLYLVLVSFDYDASGNPIMANNNVHVFATNPAGNPDTWSWSYKGKLAGQAEANELGGQRLSQTDIVKSRDGKLLMVASPDDWIATENDYNHKGCKVVEVKSISNPALERGTDGKLKVRAFISASDANALGSAASTYDPGSNTGILFTRRNKTSSSFTINIWQTGVHP